MGEFRFRRFSVVNERSAMKVNTDGVLLGALMTVSGSDRYALDLGTGTGTIALMAAQRHSDISGVSGESECGCKIVAIDIDTPSAEEAEANFRRSPWSDALRAVNLSITDYASLPVSEEEGGFAAGDFMQSLEFRAPACFDHIFSNPPYFESELKSPDLRRREARHCESMSYREIVDFAARRLSRSGRLSLILPSDVETELVRYARMCSLFLSRIVRVKTVAAKPPRRIVAEFSRDRVLCPVEEELVMQEKGRYTDEYIGLTSEFYLF